MRKILINEATVKQVIAALEEPHPGIRTSFTDAIKYREKLKQAITAIKEALAQPEQEPVAWIRRHPNGALSNEVLIHVQVETVRRESGAWVPLYTTPPQGIYYTPPQRTWVGLTDAEAEDIYRIVRPDVMKFWRECESKLKEKNT